MKVMKFLNKEKDKRIIESQKLSIASTIYGTRNENQDPHPNQNTLHSSLTGSSKKCMMGLVFFIAFMSISLVFCTHYQQFEFFSKEPMKVQFYQTNMEKQHFHHLLPSKEFHLVRPKNTILKSTSSSPNSNLIEINDQISYQEILGFGGAFTEAASIQFSKLSKSKREELLNLYYGPSGAGYTFGRVHINSCDFCEKSYNFDDIQDDIELKYFDMNVTHDQETMIPFIKQAFLKQPQLKLFASPWSPPKWMKIPIHGINSMNGSALPNGLQSKYQKTWASYISKFISAYAKQDISIWGITIQNEPLFAAPWEACAYNASFTTSFVRNYLGPILKKEYPNLKIMAYDHNRDFVYQWAQTLYNDDQASKYIDGIAVHWYSGGGDRSMDGAQLFEQLSLTHSISPNKFILSTESCNCPGVASTSEQQWFRAMRYAHDIIGDLNNWAVGWVDWNLILNHQGGPNHKGNLCDAPILLNQDEKDFTIQPLYYFLSHFSKYIVPGSKRIHLNLSIQYDQPGTPDLYNSYTSYLLPYDASARQKWSFTIDEKLKIDGTNFCLTNVITGQVEIWNCWETNTQRWRFNKQGQLINLNDGKCLTISKDSFSKLFVESCHDSNSNQIWKKKDSIIQQISTGLCVTAGYAQFQSVAFQTPTQEKVLIVLNENSVPVRFTLKDKDYQLHDNEVLGKSIVTLVW